MIVIRNYVHFTSIPCLLFDCELLLKNKGGIKTKIILTASHTKVRYLREPSRTLKQE